jgi:hypothetical protein
LHLESQLWLMVNCVYEVCWDLGIRPGYPIVAKFAGESRGLSPFNLMFVTYAGAANFENVQNIFVGIRSHW